MSPVRSLRLLSEPAYVLLGAVLPDAPNAPAAPDGDVQVLVSPDQIVTCPGDARPVLEWFARLRSRGEALAQLAEWDSDAEALSRLVEAGLVVELPVDEEGLRELLGALTTRITATARPAPDARSVLLDLGNGRAVDISLLSAAVFDAPIVRPLAVSVADVSERTGEEPDDVWSSVLVDLTSVLVSGAGNLARAGRPT